MKIALINPPFMYKNREEFGISHCLGLRSISSFLKKNGFSDIVFIDALLQGFSNVRQYANGYVVGLEPEEIINRIPKDVDMIGISVPFSMLAPIAHNIAEKAKESFPKATLVMGGVYPSTQPHLSLTSKVDYIVSGEGESAIVEIAKGRKPQEITGVYNRESIGINESVCPTDVIEDLDTIPFPDYSIPNIEQYFLMSSRTRRGKVAAIITSRGCPFSCEFCSIHPIYGHRYRFRSPENVLEEIELLIDKFDIRLLEIEDDNFTLRKDRTVKILEGIVRINEHKTHINWCTPNGVRIDTLDKEIIKLIKRSGCVSISLGLEHGNKEMLMMMNKQLDLDKAFEVIEMLVKHNIPQINLFIMVGYPGETKERFNNSVDYLKRIKDISKNIKLCVFITQPYPSTKLSARCLKEGYLENGFDNYLVHKYVISTNYTVPISTPDFREEEVIYRKHILEELFDRQAPWKKVVKNMLAESMYYSLRDIKRKILTVLS